MSKAQARALKRHDRVIVKETGEEVLVLSVSESPYRGGPVIVTALCCDDTTWRFTHLEIR